MGDCAKCGGHLYGCHWEDEDITDCDEKAMITSMTDLAYKCGVIDTIDKIRDSLTYHQAGLSGSLSISIDDWNKLEFEVRKCNNCEVIGETNENTITNSKK